MMARYVIVCRNPEDVFHSFHQFLPAYCGIDPEEIRAETFCDAIFAGASHRAILGMEHGLVPVC